MIINRKDTPVPSMHRANLPPSLNLRGAPTNAFYKESLPPTPPHRIRTSTREGRVAKVHKPRPTPRKDFMEGLTDGIQSNARGAGGNERPPNHERISHDLSLTEDPRHSVVDNMLLSLNPDQPRLISPPSSKPPRSAGSQGSSTKSLRHRGHLPSSSSAPDNTCTIDNSPSRFSTHFNRGRRSHSSTNFQSTLDRIDSVRPSEDHGPTRPSNPSIVQPFGTADRSSVPKTRAGRKSSKSSGSSSVDLGRMVGAAQWQHTPHRRSSSFDHDGLRSDYTFPTPPAQTKPNAGLIRYPSSEIAPTPTIPSGPSNRDPFPAIPARAPYHTQQAAFLQHKGSHDSMTAHKLKKIRAEGADKTLMRTGRSQSPEKARGSHQIPATQSSTNSRLESQVDGGAVSLARGLSEPLLSLRQHAGPSRERPGFFRRVFGSSRNTANSTNELRPSQLQPLRHSVRADSLASLAPSHTLQVQSSGEDGIPPSAQRVHPTVAKKPSSLFRRRKKSVSELERASGPSQLPPHIGPNNPLQPSLSLRQVMDPFLHGPSTMRSEPRALRELGPQDSNFPKLSAINQRPALRHAHSSQGSLQEAHKASTAPDLRESSTSRIRENLHAGSKVKSDDNQLHPPTDSYLHDNSSSEDRAADAHPLSAPGQDGTMASNGTANRSPVDDAYNRDQDPRLRGRKSFPSDRTPTRSGRSTPSAQRNANSTSAGHRHTQKDVDSQGWLPAVHSTLPERKSSLPGSTTRKPSLASSTTRKPSLPGSTTGSDRVWLQPNNSDENLHQSSGVSQPVNDVQEVSPLSKNGSAASMVGKQGPGKEAKIDEMEPAAAAPQNEPPTPLINGCEPTADDRELASRIYHGDESLVEKAKAAAWLGDEGLERARVRRAFMDRFEWQNMNILVALRDFCARILLKGETQQVDRLLDALSSRWCACNPSHGFKATDVVHTICYSLLLLNTDLHMAEIEAKMTRAQFIRNTMPTIRRVVADAAPDAFENRRCSTFPATAIWAESPTTEQPKEPLLPTVRNSTEGKRSFEAQRPLYRLSRRPSDQTPQACFSNSVLTPLDYDTPVDDCGPLVKAPFRGKTSTWEVQIEIVLKNFYNSIRQQRLPMHMTEAKEPAIETLVPANTLSAMAGSMLRRTPSMLSKAGSEQLSFRGRAAEQRFGTGRWTSKSRQRPRLYPASTVGSSRTSFEEPQSSAWSPAGSSTWSKYSFGRTQTSMSVESFGSSFPEGEYQQSIGFANALSQAIIREEAGNFDAAEETVRAVPLLEDESLELAGAPWAKEGILKHKHHRDAIDKKSKDKNWVESFAVIEKGYMRLFSFSMNAKSMRQKTRSQKLTGGVVGGGNWMDSAEALDQFSLRQTLASALPPPGPSRNRPHVWALSLPTGAVHFFQVGTPEIVKEFVTTANYWSARLSKEPLIGGVSNIEYGWSGSIINTALSQSDTAPAVTTHTGSRSSLQNSIRTSLDQGSSRPKLPGDKVTINDWTPPPQSMVASVLMEVDQLTALTTYVTNVEDELQRHNELRPAMLLAVRLLCFHPALTDTAPLASSHPTIP